MDGTAREFIPLFPQRHIPVILSVILKTGETLRKKTPNELENRLTRRLCRKLNQTNTFRDGPLSLHPQQEILPRDPEQDTPEGYIDILISCEYGSEVYFAIEAKRLRVESMGKIRTGSAAYVNDGMMRFVKGQYAHFMASGAMLGYVYDGDTGKARSGIGQYIKRMSAELKLLPPGQLSQSKILSGKSVDETLHQLIERKFTIYHLFLAV